MQDHTLFEILRERSVRRWIEKSDWIIENHGLVNLLVHPDYLLTQDRLDLYDAFLGYLARQDRRLARAAQGRGALVEGARVA